MWCLGLLFREFRMFYTHNLSTILSPVFVRVISVINLLEIVV